MTTSGQQPTHRPDNLGQARTAARSMFDPVLVKPAIVDSFRKLEPRTQLRNPVMFCVYVGSVLTTILWFAALAGQAEAPAGFILAIALWLWFTVLFANFAEALAEGRSKAQAASLRSAKHNVVGKKLNDPHPKSAVTITTSTDLRKGDVVLVETGDTIPPTARSSRASRRSTNLPSQANPRR